MPPYPHTLPEIAALPWLEVAEARYHEMLGVLPPARMSRGCFAVGEPLCHTDDGEPVHDTYVEISGRFFAKPQRLRDFDRNAFVRQICDQLVAVGGAKLAERVRAERMMEGNGGRGND